MTSTALLALSTCLVAWLLTLVVLGLRLLSSAPLLTPASASLPLALTPVLRLTIVLLAPTSLLLLALGCLLPPLLLLRLAACGGYLKLDQAGLLLPYQLLFRGLDMFLQELVERGPRPAIRVYSAGCILDVGAYLRSVARIPAKVAGQHKIPKGRLSGVRQLIPDHGYIRHGPGYQCQVVQGRVVLATLLLALLLPLLLLLSLLLLSLLLLRLLLLRLLLQWLLLLPLLLLLQWLLLLPLLLSSRGSSLLGWPLELVRIGSGNATGYPLLEISPPACRLQFGPRAAAFRPVISPPLPAWVTPFHTLRQSRIRLEGCQPLRDADHRSDLLLHLRHFLVDRHPVSLQLLPVET
jgi:hypothetical protein